MNPDDRCLEDVVDWTVLRSIQKANAESMSAMEAYLLVATAPGATGSVGRTRELLERSIRRHERIVEHLELAVSRLESDRQYDPTEPTGAN